MAGHYKDSSVCMCVRLYIGKRFENTSSPFLWLLVILRSDILYDSYFKMQKHEHASLTDLECNHMDLHNCI